MDVDHNREADQDESSQLDRDDPVGVVGGEAVAAAVGITWTGTNNLSAAAALEYVRRSNPPPFLRKTYAMVDDPSTDGVISWNADGTAFVVWHPAEFARDMLPTLFKHSNFSSFVRQLNTYGFRKVATSRWEFYNAMFQRGRKEILGGIRRRKAWSTHCTRQRSHQSRRPPPTVGTAPVSPTPVTAGGRDRLMLLQQGVEGELVLEEEDGRSSNDSTTSSSSPTPDQIIRTTTMDTLMDENRRLKQENGALSSDLANMKSKCDELLELVAAATHTCRTKLDVARIVSGGDCEVMRPKLFGVTLELTKRED